MTPRDKEYQQLMLTITELRKRVEALQRIVRANKGE